MHHLFLIAYLGTIGTERTLVGKLTRSKKDKRSKQSLLLSFRKEKKRNNEKVE
jgi:hypothetical protein